MMDSTSANKNVIRNLFAISEEHLEYQIWEKAYKGNKIQYVVWDVGGNYLTFYWININLRICSRYFRLDQV